METKTIELYSHEELAALKRRKRAFICAAAATGLLTLCICVFFCLRTDLLNARRMYLYTVIASLVGGWAVISIVRFAIADIDAAIKHAAAMLEGERETVTGGFAVTGERLFIKNGVAIRRVDVTGAERVTSLQLYDRKTGLFPAGKAVKVHTVYGFIVAYEV